MSSDCCGSMVVMGDICFRCKEHCQPMHDSFSNDTYEAAVDAYEMGYGPPVTRRQRLDEEMERDHYRHNGY